MTALGAAQPVEMPARDLMPRALVLIEVLGHVRSGVRDVRSALVARGRAALAVILTSAHAHFDVRVPACAWARCCAGLPGQD